LADDELLLKLDINPISHFMDKDKEQWKNSSCWPPKY
jgi:hypothetical protein